MHVAARAPAAPAQGAGNRRPRDNADEEDGNDSEGDIEDFADFNLDADDDAQDAAADFDAGASFSEAYGHNGRCDRVSGDREHAAPDFPPRLRNFNHGLQEATPLQWLFHFFPVDYLKNTVLPAIQAQEPSLNLTFPLLMNYITARLIISCHVGLPLDTFWSLDSRHTYDTTPHLGDLISANYFKQISGAFRMAIPDVTAPPDRFSEVRGLWNALNVHWSEYGIIPGWLCCNDESIASFISRYCPGFVNVKRKPKPMGNCLHCGADAATKIIYKFELQEGKDRPSHLPEEEFANLFPDGSKAGPLMMRLCKPLFGTGAVVIHDAGFASIPALCQLKKRGVFASCLLKKKKYWPKFSRGAENEAHMAGKNIGDTDALQGSFADESFAVYLMKDSEYTLQLAATYGTGNRKGPDKKRRCPETHIAHSFKYPDTIADYYTGRHACDDNNHYRQGIASIEEGWQTKKYHVRMFAVALGVCETNAKLAHDHFKCVQPSQKLTSVQWRHKIIDEMLKAFPPPIVAVANIKHRRSAELHQQFRGHLLVVKPHYTGEHVGRGPNTIDGFRKVVKQYQQQACQGVRCGMSTRMYCACNPSVPMCHTCFALHLRTVAPGN